MTSAIKQSVWLPTTADRENKRVQKQEPLQGPIAVKCRVLLTIRRNLFGFQELVPVHKEACGVEARTVLGVRAKSAIRCSCQSEGAFCSAFAQPVPLGLRKASQTATRRT